ncbi:hypothetical protein [Pelagicoccus sp. SDUM812005]|uniref:hypothetical protein n=1 Tax=Pelagicoccus sp. SDUM812005 TaxID=3041257 RepID=UPI00280E5517|nr:hypothetical protein [Pelagicoccus sp. SDUM812005]MDQ8181870.1 hypothetical protein [Pelagicoccus sp. SDUM812005]
MSKSGNAESRRGDFGDDGEAGGDFRWFCGAAFLSLLLGAVVFWKMVPVAGAADASGYLNYARILEEGRVLEELRVPEGDGFAALPQSLFQPLGFGYRLETDRLSPTYPIGLPLLLSLGGLHGSEWGLRAVYAVVAMLVCLGTWTLAAELGLAASWRFYAVALMASSPLLLWSSLIPMSDALASCQAIWLVWLALRSRSSNVAALLCGALLGWAVLTRPSNVLLFLPVLVAFLEMRVSLVKVFWTGLGGSPALALFGWSNWTLYGSPFASGYGDLWSWFSWSNGLPTLLHYAKTLLYALFALAAPTALMGAFKWRSGRTRLLLAWAAPVFVFYGFYFFTSQTWWFLRFVLVGLPALALLSACWFEERSVGFGMGRKQQGWLATGLAVAAMLALLFWQERLNIFGEQAFERRYAEECSWAKGNLEAGTLVVCMQPSGAFYYYTDFPVFRWDLAKRDLDWEGLRFAAGERDVPVVAILHAFEEQRDDSILKRYPENWELLGEVTERVRAYRMR